MGALLGTSSFSEAFRIQIGLAELLSGCTRPSGNLESDRYRVKSVVGRYCWKSRKSRGAENLAKVGL
jgi:hypothetical protein